jgi:hypothetical protein
VGKKPPQSQKGCSHGLTPWTSAGLSPKEAKNQKKNYFFIFFTGHRRPRGAPSGRLCLAGKPEINK